MQRRRSLVTKQALRHNLLCAQEQSREVYNCNALEALSRAGEHLRKTEQLLRCAGLLYEDMTVLR